MADVVAMPPVQTVAPAKLAVSLPDFKQHARYDAGDDDAMLTEYLRAAQDYVEQLCGRRLIQQTWTQAFSKLDDKLRLAFAPVSSVSQITYYDTDNASQTLTASLYRLQHDYAGAYVERDTDSDYPDTYARADAVTVTFVTGYGTAAQDVPAAIRQAIMLIAAHWSEMREDAVPMDVRSIPTGAKALIATHRRGWM